MIKAVLLDLDDTLLRNPDRVFVPEYMRLVDQFIEQRWGYPDFSRILRHYMQVAAAQRDPRQTNYDLALTMIAHASGQSADEIEAAFAEFYEKVYPQLRGCAEPDPLALMLYNKLREQELAVVIATNPIFPAEAIRQRLSWAGLPDDLLKYAYVTHSQNMHFTKPDPAYYAEIVARVGVEPDEAMMVGDNPRNDIQPAGTLGLNTYHIPADAACDDVDAAGTLADFCAMVMHDGWQHTFPTHLPGPQAIEPELRGNLGALFGMLALVKPCHWHQHPDPNEWSIMEIVCHLLESEDRVQRPRLERILAEDNPFLSAPKPPPGPGAVPPCDDDGYRVAEQFMERRQQTIRWLAQLQPEDWQRPARHSIFGPTSLLEMAHFTAQHDRLHLNQLCQTLGQCTEYG